MLKEKPTSPNHISFDRRQCVNTQARKLIVCTWLLNKTLKYL
jgi:hypothetical protein